MNKNKENFFRKMYNAQKEEEDVRKRCFEKIKNDNELYNHIMNMYTIGIMFSLVALINCVGLICTKEVVERLGTGILGILIYVTTMWIYYRNFIKPLKQNKGK